MKWSWRNVQASPTERLNSFRPSDAYVRQQNNISSDNGSLPDRRLVIIWTNAEILLIERLRTHFSESLTEIDSFLLAKMYLKMSSAKCRQFCLDPNMCFALICNICFSGLVGILLHYVGLVHWHFGDFMNNAWSSECCPPLYIWNIPLQWRLNRRDSVSNHQPHDLFTQPFIQTQTKENIKAPRHWPLCGEFSGDRWIPRTNGQ